MKHVTRRGLCVPLWRPQGWEVADLPTNLFFLPLPALACYLPQVQPDFKVGEDLVARYKDAEFMTSLGPCKVKTVKGASIK